MKEQLKLKGIKNPKGNRQIQKLCTTNGIGLLKVVEQIQKGLVNKQKGTLQVLYKRGRIDPDNCKDYTEEGKLDEFGIQDEQKSLEN